MSFILISSENACWSIETVNVCDEFLNSYFSYPFYSFMNCSLLIVSVYSCIQISILHILTSIIQNIQVCTHYCYSFRFIFYSVWLIFICSILQEYVCCCTHIFIYIRRDILVSFVLLDIGRIPTTVWVIMFLRISSLIHGTRYFSRNSVRKR